MTNYLLLRTRSQNMMCRLFWRTFTALIVLTLLALLPAGASVSADDGITVDGRQPQADPLVRCEPTSVTAPVGQTAVIDLYIQDVTNLYGADLRISYDPTIGQVVDQDINTPGIQVQVLYTFLNPFFVIQRSVYGPAASPPNCGVDCIWYASTQANPTPPATGSGAVVRVTFLGLQVGTFPMNWINTQLSAPGGIPIQPVDNQPCTVEFTNPLAVTLSSFEASAQADHVLVTWETVSELDNRGFNLYRGTSPDEPDRQLNAALIPSQSSGSPTGFVYTWEDRADLVPDTTYYYWLDDVDLNGAVTQHGPVSVDFVGPTAVTLGDLSAGRDGEAGSVLSQLWAALLAWLAEALPPR